MTKIWKAVLRHPKREVESLATLDARFHERLARLLGNATLIRQLDAINDRLFMFRIIDFATPKRVEATCMQHLAIVERVAAKDAIGARAELRRNIEDGRQIVGNSIKEALARAYAAA